MHSVLVQLDSIISNFAVKVYLIFIREVNIFCLFYQEIEIHYAVWPVSLTYDFEELKKARMANGSWYSLFWLSTGRFLL